MLPSEGCLIPSGVLEGEKFLPVAIVGILLLEDGILEAMSRLLLESGVLGVGVDPRVDLSELLDRLFSSTSVFLVRFLDHVGRLLGVGVFETVGPTSKP